MITQAGSRNLHVSKLLMRPFTHLYHHHHHHRWLYSPCKDLGRLIQEVSQSY
jgi:hypothetical protein